jgi:hypothetical protein
MRIKGDGYGGKLKKTTKTIRENNTITWFLSAYHRRTRRIIFTFIFQKMHAGGGGGADASAAVTLFLIFFPIILLFLKACNSHEFDIIYKRR